MASRMRQLKITKSITNRESQSLDKYLQEIGKEGLITADMEVELARKIKEGDGRALEKLVKANLRFVVSVAKQYQNQGLSLPDLINEGNLGLIKAAQRFDETRGFKFISYAVWWIRQSILQALAEQSRIVRLPLNQVGSLNKINKAFAKLEQEFERSVRYQRPLSVIMLDVDHFKRINDRHGHAVGDQILRAIADTLKGSVRNVDLLARFGGEEFIVLLPETGQPEALCLAERILNRVKACAVLYEGKRIATTVSAGIADIASEEAGNLEDLIRRADAALYEAKEKGRNRICLSD
ncbi:MAG: RNA polymerase sigma factor SigA [Betaproteobacteria bacterium ADurb.Bin341]|nr:MAG: RNA polymerase sigma factor SigA [Betaproteobacteria bacterium ADurb.Bin341]